jgi:hypothetical protein
METFREPGCHPLSSRWKKGLENCLGRVKVHWATLISSKIMIAEVGQNVAVNLEICPENTAVKEIG